MLNDGGLVIGVEVLDKRSFWKFLVTNDSGGICVNLFVFQATD